MMTIRISKFILTALIIVFVFILACDKYNVVEPRFYSPGDLVDIPWYDSTYTAVKFELEVPDDANINGYVINASGQFISDRLELEETNGDSSVFVWNVWDEGSGGVNPDIYGLILEISIVDSDSNVVKEYQEQLWFDLKYFDKQEFGIETIGQFNSDFYLKGMAYNNNYCYIICFDNLQNNESNGIIVLNCTVNNNPVFENFIELLENPESIKISPSLNIAVVTTHNLWLIFDISIPGEIELIAQDSLDFVDYCFYNDKLYTLRGYEEYGIKTFDLSNPTSEIPVDSLAIPTEYVANLQIKNDRVYISGRYEFYSYDISDPDGIYFIYRYSSPFPICRFDIKDNVIYAVTNRNQVRLYDISDRGRIQYLKPLYYYSTNDVFFQSNYLVIIDRNSINIFDVHDAQNPLLVGRKESWSFKKAFVVEDSILFDLDFRNRLTLNRLTYVD